MDRNRFLLPDRVHDLTNRCINATKDTNKQPKLHLDKVDNISLEKWAEIGKAEIKRLVEPMANYKGIDEQAKKKCGKDLQHKAEEDTWNALVVKVAEHNKMVLAQRKKDRQNNRIDEPANAPFLKWIQFELHQTKLPLRHLNEVVDSIEKVLHPYLSRIRCIYRRYCSGL